MSKLAYGKLVLTERWKGFRIDYWRETTGTYIWTIPLKNGVSRSGIDFPTLNDAVAWARRAAERIRQPSADSSMSQILALESLSAVQRRSRVAPIPLALSPLP